MSDCVFAYHSSTTHAGFLRAPPLAARPEARFVVAGIPWDGATTNRPGARFGPGAIRRASHMLCDGTHPAYGLSPTAELADLGDLGLPNTSIERMRAALSPQVEELIRQHHMLWLGGDHSITLSLLRAYRAHYGRALAMIHFDAHCDTWMSHCDEPSGHGTWVYEALNEGLDRPQAVDTARHTFGRRARNVQLRRRPGRPDRHVARTARPGESRAACAGRSAGCARAWRMPAPCRCT